MEFRVTIVGTKYRGAEAEAMLKKVAKGESVELRREPENARDRNAVAVYVRGVHCGYVPKSQNVEIAAALDAGREVTADVAVEYVDERLPAKLMVRL